MAISRMQEPQQIQSGIGSLQDPRQGYFLGKIVKKAGRALKKVVKSPLGKMAILGGLGALGGSFMAGGTGTGLMRFNPKNLMALARGAGSALGTGGKFSSLGDLFRVGGKSGAGFSVPRMLMGGLGATAIAAPFLMGGDDEEEEIEDVIDVGGIRQSARDYYMGTGGKNLAFMPQKKYVMENFYQPNADGGRVGYADGMMVEDEEEEFMRTSAGISRRQPRAFLQMGGGAAEQQAEQMLMAEYVKYKNQGGDMTFEQFVQAVMQQQAQGMEQPTMMAADGGRIGLLSGGPVPDSTVPGYTTPAGYNKFDYRSGGIPVRVGAQEGGIMETEVSEEIMPLLDMEGKEKDYRNTGGFVELGRKERADDVPARLSKNEFVFTADAVRNAGGGDIDKGAEVMENLMNNLEQGGQVSEDSQGLEGAQAMYDQQQMLQSRMI